MVLSEAAQPERNTDNLRSQGFDFRLRRDFHDKPRVPRKHPLKSLWFYHGNSCDKTTAFIVPPLIHICKADFFLSCRGSVQKMERGTAQDAASRRQRQDRGQILKTKPPKLQAETRAKSSPNVSVTQVSPLGRKSTMFTLLIAKHFPLQLLVAKTDGPLLSRVKWGRFGTPEWCPVARYCRAWSWSQAGANTSLRKRFLLSSARGTSPSAA